MPDLHVLPERQVVPCRPGTTVLDAALRAGIDWAHACGGNARCSTCRMVVLEGEKGCEARTPAEEAIASRLAFGPELRLACQTRAQGDVTVRRLVLDKVDVGLADIRRRRSGEARRRRWWRPARDRRTQPRPVGDERTVAVLFADIRGFTPFSAALLPYDVIHVLERYLRDVTDTVEHHGGVVTSYLGDGVMALFGAGDEGDPAAAAVRAGVALVDAADHQQAHIARLYGEAFDVNVGIHYGSAIVGSLFGNPRTITAIGDTVNVASRVEQANKQAGTRLLVTEAVLEHVRHHAEVGRTVRCQLAGKEGEYTLYEIAGWGLS